MKKNNEAINKLKDIFNALNRFEVDIKNKKKKALYVSFLEDVGKLLEQLDNQNQDVKN